jgi:hypothetical protein
MLADEVTQIDTCGRTEAVFGTKKYHANYCTRNIKSMAKILQ